MWNRSYYDRSRKYGLGFDFDYAHNCMDWHERYGKSEDQEPKPDIKPPAHVASWHHGGWPVKTSVQPAVPGANPKAVAKRRKARKTARKSR